MAFSEKLKRKYDAKPRKEYVLWSESMDPEWVDEEHGDDGDYTEPEYEQAVCFDCGGKHFEVFTVRLYITAVRCVNCGAYAIAHEG